MRSVTLVITSRLRFDLLERTLSSFFAFNDYPLTRAVIVEDSDDRGVHDVAAKFAGHRIEVLINGATLGQFASTDRAYATVDSEFIFHCEDDWLFHRPGIIRDSIDILDAEPNAVMVLARRIEDRPYYFNSLRLRAVNGARYRRAEADIHHVWFTFTFNPGLRRLSDYRLIPGGYQALGSEAETSLFYKRLGRSMVWLDDGQVEHIGYGRGHAFVARKPPADWAKWRRRAGKWRRSLERRLAHWSRLTGITRQP